MSGSAQKRSSAKRGGGKKQRAQRVEHPLLAAARRSPIRPPSVANHRGLLGPSTSRRLHIPGVNVARAHPCPPARALPVPTIDFVHGHRTGNPINFPVFANETVAAALLARVKGEYVLDNAWLFELDQTCRASDERDSSSADSFFEIRAAIVALNRTAFRSLDRDTACYHQHSELLRGIEARHRDVLHHRAVDQLRIAELEALTRDLIERLDVKPPVKQEHPPPIGDEFELNDIKANLTLVIRQNIKLASAQREILDTLRK